MTTKICNNQGENCSIYIAGIFERETETETETGTETGESGLGVWGLGFRREDDDRIIG